MWARDHRPNGSAPAARTASAPAHVYPAPTRTGRQFRTCKGAAVSDAARRRRRAGRWRHPPRPGLPRLRSALSSRRASWRGPPQDLRASWDPEAQLFRRLSRLQRRRRPARHAPRISQPRTPTSSGSQRRRSAVLKCSSPLRQDISAVQGARRPQSTSVTGRRASVEEQEVGKVDSGQLFQGGDSLRQFGELEREFDGQALEPFTSLNHAHTGNDQARGLGQDDRALGRLRPIAAGPGRASRAVPRQ